jgi:GNAT superfamily N-acetyltransferase
MSVLEQHGYSVEILHARAEDHNSKPELIIEAVHRDHVTELTRILLNLDQSSRLSRFGMVANDNHLIEHVSLALSRSALIAAVFVESRMRGFVEIYDADPLGFAEAAFVVEHQWRRRGIGSALLRKAILWTAKSDVSKLRMVFARDNWPMRKMARNARASFDLVLNEVVAEIDPIAWHREESAHL